MTRHQYVKHTTPKNITKKYTMFNIYPTKQQKQQY